MHNITLELPNRPGVLADLGQALGAAGISVEGGGIFAVGSTAIGNFLVADGHAAKRSLSAAGITVTSVREVLLQRLDQSRPGQLGLIARRMAEAGVNIEVQYSDHDHQLVLVVDDLERGRVVSQQWQRV